MQYSKSADDFLERNFEGCELRAYQDSGGVWTIGYGHTNGVHEGMQCTLAQAENWLKNDLKIAETAVANMVHVPLSQGEFDALVDFAFNLGIQRLRSSTLLFLLNLGEYQKAAAEFDKWDRCGGKIMAGLLRRREAETKVFEDGTNQIA